MKAKVNIEGHEVEITLTADQIEEARKDLDITKRINGLEDIFTLTKPTLEEATLLNYDGPSRRLIGAKNMLLGELISEAYAQGKEADFENGNQYKWAPVFEGGGFAFSVSFFDRRLSYACVGSRLWFAEERLSNDAVKKFPDVFKNLLSKK